MIPKICIVGAGPAGFYTAQHCLKLLRSARIDIFERLPVPFGLVRYGVAPDHPEVKNVEHTFTKIGQHPHVQFFGNVCLGRDIHLKQLREAYHAVVLTYGADEDRKLHVRGEDLGNVVPARRIVGWYNGVPEDRNLPLDLSGRTVAIFGQGNVAIDVARILLTPVDRLATTDITAHALHRLSTSHIQRVHLIGRRGPLQAAFTIKELREMLKLPTCHTRWNCADFAQVAPLVDGLQRPRRRLTQLMCASAQQQVKEESSGSNLGHAHKTFEPVFFRSPIAFGGTTNVEHAILGVNRLEGEWWDARAVLTEARERLDVDLVCTSIGYRSLQVDADIPFDASKGLARHYCGKIDEGLYSGGWLATGARGVLLTTMANAFATAELICRDLEGVAEKGERAGGAPVEAELRRRNVARVTWRGWERIDAYEREAGREGGKPREKMVDVGRMLEIAM